MRNRFGKVGLGQLASAHTLSFWATLNVKERSCRAVLRSDRWLREAKNLIGFPGRCKPADPKLSEVFGDRNPAAGKELWGRSCGESVENRRSSVGRSS